MRLRAESAESRRRFDECQRRLEERVSELDPGGRIPRLVANRPAQPVSFERSAGRAPVPAAAIVDLVDLSSRRITALEEEIGTLEAKLRTAGAELSAAQLECKERDLEILRLNSAYEERGSKAAGGGELYGSDPVARLSDQVDYLHERSEALEREGQEQRDQFQKEKDELHRRWVQTENERVRLSEQLSDAQPEQRRASEPVGPVAVAAAGEVERLRTECSNIKSLYAQTRDQLQEVLQTGGAEARQAREQAAATEAALRTELADARQTVGRLEAQVAELRTAAGDAAAHQAMAQSRERQAAKLEKRQAKLGAQLAAAQDEARRATQTADERQRQYDGTMGEYRRLVEQHEKLDRGLKQAVAEVAEWRAKVDERDYKLGDTARRLDEYRLLHKQDATELRSARRTLESYSGDLATLRDAHDNAQRDAARLRDELEQTVKLRRAVEMAKDDYKRQLVKALAESETHRGLVAHLQAERRALRVQVKAQFHLCQRLEQRLEALDPEYAHEPLVADASLPLLPPLPAARRAGSRSSSAAHSSRSFEDIPAAAYKPRLAALDTSDSDSDSDSDASAPAEATSTSPISLP
ncbi:hypothetical protein H4R21_002165 [Coemansia helicoidea]|uniref:Uncharacterized protein n=1 Tax=Coemansia helicoidea TaxID=1286919 RepID=A0ACC1L8I1_9FUNG|nr:hypothetical protein H4R21_002165 [Coemansia helicoidea]